MRKHKRQRRYKSKKGICLIALVFSFVYLFCGCGFATNSEKLTEATSETESSNKLTTVQSAADEDVETSEQLVGQSDGKGTILVHVCGAVRESGVYQLNAGDRVVDAVQAAGGFTKKADAEQLNQAELVYDGQRLYIPKRGENIDASDVVQNENVAGTSGEQESAKVNLNRATAEELMTLPGIGQSKADAIITYREEHGGFQNIEELKQISGIKDGVFNKIKDNITVG